MGLRTLISRRGAVAVLALIGGGALVAALGVSVALTLAPGLLLALLLARSIFPGEELIARLRGVRTRGRRRSPAAAPRPDLPLVVLRTGRRLHAALAMRPPPVAARLAA